MSGPPVYNQWMKDTLDELGARLQIINNPAATLQAGPPGRPLMPLPTGKGGTRMPMAAFLRNQAFGTQATRATIDQQSTTQITELRDNGFAAPVAIQTHGRTLSGNFYSAKGHNLKENNGAPDLTRPLVLLLTGSHGSAEDQGLEMAEFYAKEGASVMSVNFGGFGSSTPGDPTEESLLQDGHAMLQRAVDLGYDPDKIVIHGFSMGGAIAGKLKETVEAGGQYKMRGLVLDRPMLSMAHGVETKLPGVLSKVGLSQGVAQYSRKALGTFSARSAIAGSANTDTRMVISSDEDRFADAADAFRTQLTAGGRAVTGTRTDAAHMLHGEMLKKNDAQLRQLVAQDRGGAPANVASGRPESTATSCMALLSEMNTYASSIDDQAQDLAARLTEYQNNPPASGMIRVQLARGEGALKQAMDLMRYAPDPGKQRRARAQADRLEGTMKGLTALLTASGVTLDSGAGLIDSVQDRARRALGALQAAGGPSATNLALERAVLDADNDVRTLRGSGFDQQLLADLLAKVAEIGQRRTPPRVRPRRRAVGQ